jgi:hypothetical protein
MIPADRLRALRNNAPVLSIIFHLGIPTKMRQARVTFRCPLCGQFRTATSEVTNLARCFLCQQNFNPIDLVMAERAATFLEAVNYVEDFLGVTR